MNLRQDVPFACQPTRITIVDTVKNWMRNQDFLVTNSIRISLMYDWIFFMANDIHMDDQRNVGNVY